MISTADSLANSDEATSLLGASLRTVLVLVGSSALVEIGFVVGALTSTLDVYKRQGNTSYPDHRM